MKKLIKYFRDLFASDARQQKADEKYYSSDLNLAGYPGKWEKAKELTANTKLTPTDGIAYWLKVRDLYLALGGEYKARISSDGSGHFASGTIRWDRSGNINAGRTAKNQ